DFLLAASYHAYSSTLWNSRVVGRATAANAIANVQGTAAPTASASDVFIPNEDVFQGGTLTFDTHRAFAAAYAGDIANGLQIVIVDSSQQFTDDSFAKYKGRFPSAPGTSDYAASKNCSDDEIHVVIVDALGEF